MKSKEYIDGVIRTESNRFDNTNVTEDQLRTAVGLFIAAGQALDAIKRAFFYGKPMDQEKFETALTNAFDILGEAKNFQLNGYSDKPSVSPRIIHAALGFGTESAEILEKVLASLTDNSSFDYANLFEELSDINWYQGLAIDAASKEDPESMDKAASHPSAKNVYTTGEARDFMGGLRDWSYENIWEKNLAKLKARYPNKFETDKAFSRDLEAEKKALE